VRIFSRLGNEPGASGGTSPDSAIAKYVEKRGPGLHHITLRWDDISAALAQLKARGARLVDEQPRPGAEGALVAFVHPSSAHGVLVELKQVVVISHQSSVSSQSSVIRYRLGDFELISLFDGFSGSTVAPCSVSCRRRSGRSRRRPTIATGS